MKCEEVRGQTFILRSSAFPKLQIIKKIDTIDFFHILISAIIFALNKATLITGDNMEFREVEKEVTIEWI